MSATFDQALDLLQMVKTKLDRLPPNTRTERLQALKNSGLLSDVFDTPDYEAVNRDKVRALLGLELIKVGPFKIRANFTANIHDLLSRTLWRFEIARTDYPLNKLARSGNRDAICIPFQYYPNVTLASSDWISKGLSLADLRETLVIAITSDLPGAYVCPFPVTASESGPVIGEDDVHYFAIIRTPNGLMHLVTNQFSYRLIQPNDWIPVQAGKYEIKLKKKDMFMVMMCQHSETHKHRKNR